MPPRLFRRLSLPKQEAPAAQKRLERPSAQDIFEQVANNARQELGRSSVSLAISGFAGGIFMGLSALGNAIAIAMLTPLGSSPTQAALFIGKMFYPLGFIVVILGRSQLFTENTLYPVALVLAEKNHLRNTLRLWAMVLPFNVLGALAFATLATRTSALPGPVVQWLIQLGLEAGRHPAATIFWSGIMGGWIIATVAWLVSGSHSLTGSVMIIWMLALVVGLGNFAHCIAGAGEVFAPILAGRAPWSSFLRWFLPAVAGNICGGVGMVTLLEYGQVIVGKDAEAEALPPAENTEAKAEAAA
jgi:formate/nitrite transporter FocA (FNT family)